MPRAVFALSWSAALETYVLSGPRSGEDRSIVPDCPDWFVWLGERSSFAFHGQSGSYTARLEAVQRGERYWYAYRRTSQKLHKKYLGKTNELTIARLEQVARLLYAAPGSALPQEQPMPARTPQSVTRTRKTTNVPATVIKEHTTVPSVSTVSPALADEPLHPLLSSRLHVPRLPARLVHRSHLIERLQQGLSQSLILLSAPPGFGKTTLLAEFVADCGVPRPGSPSILRITTRSASSPLCWPPSRPVIPRLVQVFRRTSPRHTVCKASPSLPSSRC